MSPKELWPATRNYLRLHRGDSIHDFRKSISSLCSHPLCCGYQRLLLLCRQGMTQSSAPCQTYEKRRERGLVASPPSGSGTGLAVELYNDRTLSGLKTNHHICFSATSQRGSVRSPAVLTCHQREPACKPWRCRSADVASGPLGPPGHGVEITMSICTWSQNTVPAPHGTTRPPPIFGWVSRFSPRSW